LKEEPNKMKNMNTKNKIVLLLVLLIINISNSFAQSVHVIDFPLQKAINDEGKNFTKGSTAFLAEATNASVVSPVNDTICGAIELILNAPLVGDNTALANASDASDVMATNAGYTVSVTNNTLWYYYTAPNNDSVEVQYGGPAGANELYGWLGVFTASSCAGPLTYLQYMQNGTQYSGNISKNKLKMIAGTTYYFMVDGVVGSTGLFLLGLASITSGINEFENNFRTLSVYPNPANTLLSIEYSFAIAAEMNVQLLDVTGRVVYSDDVFTSKKGVNTVNVNDLNNGIYILKLSNGSGNISRKVLIQH
jgi:hypothetical protein